MVIPLHLHLKPIVVARQPHHMSQASPLPTIPEGADDEIYGDGMDMDTLLDEMGLGDDDAPPTPPQLLSNHAKLTAPPQQEANPQYVNRSSQSGAADMKSATRSPIQDHALVRQGQNFAIKLKAA